MSKTYQTISRIVIIILLGFVCFKGLYAFYTLKESEIVVAGDGIVTGKFETDYACGSKSRYTCYSRFLILDDTNKVEVNFDTFKSMQIGDKAYLTYKKQNEISGWVGFGFIVNALICIVLAVFVFLFCFWSVFKSSKMKFTDFLIKLL